MKRKDLSGARWRKSSPSGAADSNCVEVADLDDGWVAVRDSKDPCGPALVFTPAEWDAFLKGTHAGELATDDERVDQAVAAADQRLLAALDRAHDVEGGLAIVKGTERHAKPRWGADARQTLRQLP